MRSLFALLISGAIALALAGCGDNPLEPIGSHGPGDPNGPDTVVIVSPPDTIIVPPPDSCATCPPDTIIVINPGAGNCGEVRLEAFNVTRSTPVKFLGSFPFDQAVTLNLFARIDNYRVGGGHDNQDIQFYLVHDGDQQTVVVKRPGDDCGVLSDTTYTGAVTRFVGSADLAAGTWSVYAVHGSQVSCFTQSSNGNGPVSVEDAAIKWCNR